MALTTRFDELVQELNLPEAAWHLSRTNSGTEKHATSEEIERGRQHILNLLNNQDDCVGQILEQVDTELKAMEPIDILLRKRHEATLQQWKNPIENEKSTGDYNTVIKAIIRRALLEKTRKQAELILNGGFQVIEGGAQKESANTKVAFTIKESKEIKKAA